MDAIGKISKFRSELMGIATIMILYVSSVLYGLMDMIDDENIKSPIGIELDSREVKELISECKGAFLSASWSHKK